MHWIDIAILLIIAISALISLVRGFIREALSLAGWIIAIWVALNFSSNLADLLGKFITVPSLRIIIAFTVLFVTTLLVAAMVNHLMVQLIKKTGLTGTDRMIGIIFGAVRGGVVVGILVLLAGLTTFPQDPSWQESKLVGHFQKLAVWMGHSLSPDVTANLRHE
jgi:membrane protein required for colicin V production